MRNRNRLPKIYNTVLEGHQKFSDIRFGQLMMWFFEWHENHYGTDVWYVEDDTLLLRFDEFINMIKETYVEK